MPRPWCASATTNATSASSVPGRALVAADGDDLVAELATNATRSWWSTWVNRTRSRSGMRGYGREVAQVAGTLRTARRGTPRARRRRSGGSGAGAPCRRRRRRRRPPSARAVPDRPLGSVTGIVRVEAEQREDRPPGGADRAVQPAVAAGHPGSGLRRACPRPSCCGSSPRAAAARAGRRSTPAGSRCRGSIGSPVASASRCVQVRGTQRTRPYPPPP